MRQHIFLHLIFLLLSSDLAISQVNSSRIKNQYSLSEKSVQWMREATIQQLSGCRVEGKNGIWIHTPDGVGNYKALWTRVLLYG